MSRFSVNAPPNILGINTSNTFSSIQQNVIQGNTTLDKIAYQNFTFTGIKTFSVPPVCAVAPTSNTQLVNKLYVDANSASAWSTFPATSNVSIGQYTMNFVINSSPNHFVRLTRSQITVQNSPLHVHLTSSGITCTNTTTAQNAVLDCSSLTFTGSAGSQIVFSDSTVQTTAFTNAFNTRVTTLETKTTDISYSSSTTTINNGVSFPSLLSTMPTTNTGNQYGLSLYWNKSGGLGEVDYLAMGQGAGNIAGHAFYCSNASNAPVLCLTLTPTSLLIPSTVVTTFNGNISANSQTVTPTQLGYISGLLSNAQTQINTIATTTALKANLASPTFTGTPAGPTATAGTSTTQLATTAFVTAVDVLKANIDNPTFTGTLTVPTITNTLAFTQNGNKSFVVANTNIGQVGLFSGTGNVYNAPYFANTFGSVATNCEVIIGNGAINGSCITFRCYQTGTSTFTITCSGTSIFLYDNTNVTSYVLSYATNPCVTLVSLNNGGWVIVNTGVDTLKANLVSPTFTGTPAAPTATAGTNTTQLATTAFVTTADNLKANLASPTFTGTPAAPTATAGTNTTQLATTAFVTAADALKANLASPTFTGTPAAPTAAAGTNTTQIATTAFVATAFAKLSGGNTFSNDQILNNNLTVNGNISYRNTTTFCSVTSIFTNGTTLTFPMTTMYLLNINFGSFGVFLPTLTAGTNDGLEVIFRLLGTGPSNVATITTSSSQLIYPLNSPTTISSLSLSYSGILTYSLVAFSGAWYVTNFQ